MESSSDNGTDGIGGALLLMADFDAGVEEKGVLEDDEAEFDGEAGERGLWVMVLHFFVGFVVGLIVS